MIIKNNKLTVKSTDSWHDHFDNTIRGASSIREVRRSATSDIPPLERNSTQLLSTSGWGEPAHRGTIDQSNVTTQVTTIGDEKKNSNMSIEYPERRINERDESYVSRLREVKKSESVGGNRIHHLLEYPFIETRIQ